MTSKMTTSSGAKRQTNMVLKGEGKNAADDVTKFQKDDNRDVTKTPELKSQLGDNFNLVWKALAKKAPVYSGDPELK